LNNFNHPLEKLKPRPEPDAIGPNGCLAKTASLPNASMVTTSFIRSSAIKQGRTAGLRNMNLELTDMESTVSLPGNIQGFETRENALRDCEENANVMAKALES
jgi:hypothetical protein